MSDSEQPTPPTNKRLPRVLVVRGTEPSVADAVFEAAVEAQLLVVEVAFPEVAAFVAEERPLAVVVLAPLYFEHIDLFDDLCRAVDARLIVLPVGTMDWEALAAELRSAAERNATWAID